MSAINIQALVEEFYAIEAVNALISVKSGSSDFDPFRHSHSKWYDDFMEFRTEYAHKLSSAIYDYTVLVVAGELRHAHYQCAREIEGYETKDVTRDCMYTRSKNYSSESILKAGDILFDKKYRWMRYFGGPKWQKIAKAGLLRSKLNDIIFIDHCVDLSHNCSVYFDKGANIFGMPQGNNNYKEFLNLKRDVCPEVLLRTERYGNRLRELIKRACVLNILYLSEKKEFVYINYNESEEQILQYVPIVWGKKQVVCKLVPSVRGSKMVCGDDHDKKYPNELKKINRAIAKAIVKGYNYKTYGELMRTYNEEKCKRILEKKKTSKLIAVPEKFKLGDEVIYTGSCKCCQNKSAILDEKDGNSWHVKGEYIRRSHAWWNDTDFVLAKDPAFKKKTSKKSPMFKVGDRVMTKFGKGKIIGHYPYSSKKYLVHSPECKKGHNGGNNEYLAFGLEPDHSWYFSRMEMNYVRKTGQEPKETGFKVGDKVFTHTGGNGEIVFIANRKPPFEGKEYLVYHPTYGYGHNGVSSITSHLGLKGNCSWWHSKDEMTLLKEAAPPVKEEVKPVEAEAPKKSTEAKELKILTASAPKAPKAPKTPKKTEVLKAPKDIIYEVGDIVTSDLGEGKIVFVHQTVVGRYSLDYLVYYPDYMKGHNGNSSIVSHLNLEGNHCWWNWAKELTLKEKASSVKKVKKAKQAKKARIA